MRVYLDSVSLSFLRVVRIISAGVFFYTRGYIRGDAGHDSSRFRHILLLFVVSIAALILIPDFPGILLGWDGLGLSSFFLVLYYQDSTSLGSGLITGLTNRVGDRLILVSFSLWVLGGLGT